MDGLMKSNTKWILAGVVGIIAYNILAGVKALKITLSNYVFRNFDFTDNTVGLNLYFKIKNPLLFGVTLRAISGTITATSIDQTEVLGTVDNQYKYFIGGLKTHMIPAVLKVSTTGVLKAFAENIASGNVNNLLITFDGYISFGETAEVKVPIKKSFTVKEITGNV